MAANTVPIFALIPTTIGVGRIAAANTASDGSGALVTLYTAATNGARFDKVVVLNSQATAAASSAMVVRLFITDTAGANPRLIAESALAAATRSTTVVGATVTFTFSGGYIMLAGQILQACQSLYAGVADQNDVSVQQYGQY